MVYRTVRYRTVMRRWYGNFPIFYPENCRTFWRIARRTVREQFVELFAKWPFLQFLRTLFMNSSRTIRRTIRQMTFFASPANTFHEPIANSSLDFSPNELFSLPGEHCSWTVREQFAELSAKTPFCPILRTLFMNSLRAFHRTVRQKTCLETLANNVHEHQLYNCSQTVRRTIRQTDNIEINK
jgi:hypothetical protein